MDPLEQFESDFNEAYGALLQLLAATNQPPLPPVDDVLGLTVAEFTQVIEDAKQAVQAIPPQDVADVLAQVGFFLPQEARDFLEAVAAEDYDTAFAPLDAIVDSISDNPPDAVLRDVLDDGTGSGGGDGGSGGGDGGTGGGDGGDGGSGGGDGGGDGGGGGGSGGGDGGSGGGGSGSRTPAEIIAAIEALIGTYESQLGSLLWGGTNGTYTSPVFQINDTTGSWTSENTGSGSLTGSSLDDLYEHLGEASARAVLAYIGTRPDVIATAVANGATESGFQAALASIIDRASDVYEALQEMGADATGSGPNNAPSVPLDSSAWSDFISFLENSVNGFDGAFDGLIFGSRNSDPSFLVGQNGNVSGSEHGDWMFLSEGNDSFDGGAGMDVVFGMGGNDSLNGGAANDVIIGGAGNDDIDGGAGNADVAHFEAAMGQFTIQFASDGSATVEDRASNGEGTDTVRNVEVLTFETGASIFQDGEFDLTRFNGMATLNEDQISSFIELYIAYFNRAPDAIGLNFWGTAFANGTSLEEMATLFIDQDETRATYPDSLSNEDFATTVYGNVLGRVADADGFNFWVSALDSGGVSRDQFILAVLGGAKADPPANATQDFIDQQLADRAYLANKTDIGAYFAVHKGLSSVEDATAAMAAFDGTNAGITAAVEAIDGFYDSALDAQSGELLLPIVGVLDDPFAVV